MSEASGILLLPVGSRRKNDLRILHVFYRRIGVACVCYYCGFPADTRDHVPPLSLVPLESSQREDLPLWLVPACRECNSVLGDSPVLLLEARRFHLAEHYRKRYQKELAIPDWGPEELQKLGHTLRSKVVAGLKLRDALRVRMMVLEVPREEPEWESVSEEEKEWLKAETITWGSAEAAC